MKPLLSFLCVLLSFSAKSSHILIPMDESQTNHLKAYGIAYWGLSRGQEINWLLNYRGGSFMCSHQDFMEAECRLRGVKADVISDGEALSIINQIQNPDVNMDIMKLEKI